MPTDADFDPDAPDPLISAVVEVREDAASSAGAVGDPIDVVSEAAAVIGGVDLGLDVAAAPDPGRPDDVPSPGPSDVLARAKGWFEKAGFEVHAPIRMTFSIAAQRSFFENFFSVGLVVDEEHFFVPVTTADGGDQLPTDPLPEEIRSLVRSISLPPPPDLPDGLTL